MCLSGLVLVEASELPGVETQVGDPGVGGKGGCESYAVSAWELARVAPCRLRHPAGEGTWMSLACGHRPTIPRPIVAGDC